MIQNISRKISNFLINSGLPSENSDIYSYGAECFLNLFICDSLLLLFGFFSNHFLEILFWLISFACLRHHIGGYHANSHFACIFMSVSLGIFSLIINKIWILFPILILIALCFCIICVFKLAPVIHVNHPITAIKKQQEHTKGILILLFEVFLILFLYLNESYLVYPIISGIFTAAFCCFTGYTINKLTED